MFSPVSVNRSRTYGKTEPQTKFMGENGQVNKVITELKSSFESKLNKGYLNVIY